MKKAIKTLSYAMLTFGSIAWIYGLTSVTFKVLLLTRWVKIDWFILGLILDGYLAASYPFTFIVFPAIVMLALTRMIKEDTP